LSGVGEKSPFVLVLFCSGSDGDKAKANYKEKQSGESEVHEMILGGLSFYARPGHGANRQRLIALSPLTGLSPAVP
jgi:hypothetical protein